MIVLCSRLFDMKGNEQAEVVAKIVEPCKGKRVQIVVNAKPKNEFYRFAKYIALFAKYGIEARLVDLTQDSLSFNEIILLGGGSPRLLMEVIKKTGCEREIKEIYRNTGLIIGQSAGAMALLQQFVDDKGVSQEFALFKGLGLCDDKRCVLPDYDDLPIFDYGQRCLKFVEENNIEVLPMRNDEVITF